MIMIVYVLLMFAANVSLNHPMVFKSEKECTDMGQQLIEVVQSTLPGHAKPLTFRCDAAVMFP